MDSITTPRLEANLLYRRLDSLFGALDPELPPRRLMESFLEDAFTTLRGDPRLKAGLAYAEGRDDFSLLKAVGRLDRPPADAFDSSARPIALVLQHGVYIFPDPDHDDAPARYGLAPRGPVAAAQAVRASLRARGELGTRGAPRWVHVARGHACRRTRPGRTRGAVALRSASARRAGAPRASP